MLLKYDGGGGDGREAVVGDDDNDDNACDDDEQEGWRIVKYDTRKTILRKKQNGRAEGRRSINNLIIW